MADKVVVYTTHGCGYTDMLTEQLGKEGVAWEEVLPLTDGERITPVMIGTDGEVTIGFNGFGCVE